MATQDSSTPAVKAPLDEVMLAMDVVDTLRHRRLVVERELGAEARDESLLQRLRDIYRSQGIDVPDAVLEEGVDALRRDRFVYHPAGSGFSRTLAEWYVNRGRWGKWVAGASAILLLVWAGSYFVDASGDRAERTLQNRLDAAYTAVSRINPEQAVLSRADGLRADVTAAIADDDLDAAREGIISLEDLHDRLEQSYELRVVSRPGEPSGVWRIPDVNSSARNYYLIVEAIQDDGRPAERSIRSEEDGATRAVTKWGLRVDPETFQRFVDDKQADGIIDEPVVGRKRRGSLEPDYAVDTTGGAITAW